MSALMRPEPDPHFPLAAHTSTERELRARREGMLAERTRIAGELHDTLLQGFTGIALQLESICTTLAPSDAAATLTRVLAQAYETLRETRQMVWDMRAPEQDTQDLARTLEEAANAMTGSDVQLRCVVNGARRRLSPTAETTVLRIGREAVANAIKHAEAQTVDVELTYEPRVVRLAVRDDGRGASTVEIDRAAAGGHWGITRMRERATREGASLQIVSAPGEGTRVSLSLPTEV